MSWSISFGWELSSYVILLFLLWIIIRYFAGHTIEMFHSFITSQNNGTNLGTAKVDPWINGVHYAVSYWTERGGRPYQEDRHQESKGISEKDSSIYAVYDGHAGHRAAQYCKDNLFKVLLEDSEFVTSPANALKKTFQKVNSEFSTLAKSNFFSDGTTAVVAVVHRNRITVANAGDSRCILIQKSGKVKHMSVDHKPNREDEERRIRSLGGEVTHWGRWRVQGILAVSRAIGDVSLQPFVSCEPEILEKDISADDTFLVLASDGVWDVMNNEAVAKFITVQSTNDFINLAKGLCNEALLLGSTDNVTALVIDLRRRNPGGNESQASNNNSIARNATPVSSPQSSGAFLPPKPRKTAADKSKDL